MDNIIQNSIENNIPLLKCEGVTKNYVRKTAALNNLNLTLTKGKIIGLLGPNGSGKTTLIKIIAGLLRPTYGKITVNGFPIGIETKKMVSYLPDKTYIADWMKVDNMVNFFSDFYSDFNKQKAYDMINRLHLPSKQTFKQMSKGTQEKLQLILVMSREAELYLLDEPIGGVDPAARDYILETIITNHSPNSTVLISTHLIADIENVLDEFIFIKDGNLELFSTVDRIREERGMSVDSLFREVYRC